LFEEFLKFSLGGTLGYVNTWLLLGTRFRGRLGGGTRGNERVLDFVGMKSAGSLAESFANFFYGRGGLDTKKVIKVDIWSLGGIHLILDFEYLIILFGPGNGQAKKGAEDEEV